MYVYLVVTKPRTEESAVTVVAVYAEMDAAQSRATAINEDIRNEREYYYIETRKLIK